jgi:hypothetical protein
MTHFCWRSIAVAGYRGAATRALAVLCTSNVHDPDAAVAQRNARAWRQAPIAAASFSAALPIPRGTTTTPSSRPAAFESTNVPINDRLADRIDDDRFDIRPDRRETDPASDFRFCRMACET